MVRCIEPLRGHRTNGYPTAWGSGHVIATLVVGCVSLIVFAFYEIYAKLEQPYIPMYLFKNKSYIAVLVTVCVVVMSYYALA
jgi:hypothetical protein